jgi:TolA-binding protein
MTTPPLKETPEEMEKRVRAKIKAEQPEDVPPSLDPSSTKVKKADGGMGGMMFYVKMAIVAFIISFLVVTFVATSPLNAQLKTVNTTATSALASANTAIDNAKKAQASVDSVNASISAVQTSLQTASADTTSKISAINGQISALQNSIATINNQLKGYATTSQLSGFISGDQLSAANSTIAALQTTIKTLQAQLATDEANITANQAAIKALQTTTTPTTTPTSNKVTAVIVPNTFGGGQTISFASLPNSTSTPNTESGNFNFMITNNTSVTVNNIQMAVILEVLAGNGSTNSLVDLTNVSYAATVAINLNGYITSWTQQSTGQIGVLGFTNVIPSGLLANLGTISQTPGTSAPYTVTVTITIAPTSTTTPVPSFTIVPMVKVVSYQ